MGKKLEILCFANETARNNSKSASLVPRCVPHLPPDSRQFELSELSFALLILREQMILVTVASFYPNK